MLKVNDALCVNNGFTSCVAFDHKAHRHGEEHSALVNENCLRSEIFLRQPLVTNGGYWQMLWVTKFADGLDLEYLWQ